MRVLGLRDAKASLSAVVEAAERGEATTITKHGKPAGVVARWRKPNGCTRPSGQVLRLC